MRSLETIINLIGLKSTDPQLIAAFKENNIAAPPKSVNANQGSKTCRDKITGFEYLFRFDIVHDKFYPPISPRNDDYTFEAYLSGISLYDNDKSFLKKYGAQPLEFWGTHIHPNSSFEEAMTYFNNSYKENKYDIFFKKSLNEIAGIKAWFTSDEKIVKAIELAIIETPEIFSHYDFKRDNPHNSTKEAYTLLVKWMFDNKLLKLPQDVYEQTLSLDYNEILEFTETHLHNHVWDSQIVDMPHLRRYLYTIKTANKVEDEQGNEVDVYIKHIFIKAAGAWEKYQEIYHGNRRESVVNILDNFVASLRLNEQQTQTFFSYLSENFELYKRLNHQ